MDMDIAFKAVIILNVFFGMFIYWQTRQIRTKDINNDIAHKLQFLMDENKTIWNKIDGERERCDNVCERLSRIEGKLEVVHKLMNGKN